MRKLIVLLVGLLTGLALALPAAAATAGRTFTVDLIPIPSGDPDGSGTATVTVNPGQGQVCYDIEVSGIDQPQEPAPGLGSAHIHVLPSGGIAVDLEAEFVAGSQAGTYEAAGCVSADRDVLVNILRNPEDYYVNVHTAAFPAGAVQGSLG